MSAKIIGGRFDQRASTVHWLEPTLPVRMSRSVDETAKLTRIVTALSQAQRGHDLLSKALEQLAYDLPDAEMEAALLHRLYGELCDAHLEPLLRKYGSALALPPDSA